jgi:hypothetical protein
MGSSPDAPGSPHASGNRTVPSPAFVVILAAALVFAVVAMPTLLLRPKTGAQLAQEGIRVVVGRIDLVPEPTRTANRALLSDLTEFSRTLYTRAFLLPRPTPARSSETPGPGSGIDDFFTPAAIASLHAHPGVFAPGDRVIVRKGVLSLGGVATLDGGRVQAFLDVTFEAAGDASGVPVALHQAGRLLLSRVGGSWRVSGFELALSAAPITPSPSAS